MRSAVEEIKNMKLPCYGPTLNPDENVMKANETLAEIARIEKQVEKAEKAFEDDPAADKIKESGDKLVGTLKCAVSSFKNVTKCYFVKTTWDEVADLVCSGVTESLFWLALAELTIAILAVPYAITTLCILKRHGGHGPLAHDDDLAADAVEIKEIEVGTYA